MRPILLSALLALAPPALAQDAAEEAPSEEVRAAAERYVEGEAMQSMIDQMLSPEATTQAMRAQFGDSIPPEELEQIVTIVTEEFETIEPAMEEAMIEATAQTFTLEEIEAQIEFYESGPGSAILTKMQPFMTAFYEAIGPEMQAANERAMERAMEMAPAE